MLTTREYLSHLGFGAMSLYQIFRNSRFLNDFTSFDLSWFNWWVSFAPDFQCWYFCESACLFYLRFNFDFYVSKIMHL